jgi:transposase
MRNSQEKISFPVLTKEQASNMIKKDADMAANLLVSLTESVNMLSEKVTELTAEVNDLKSRLAKDSSNSSKPPSSDGYSKPSPKSLRKKSGKKSGGQKGHKGSTLSKVSNPDHTINHNSGKCSCGRCLEEGAILSEERRQVFDIPIPRLEVTEHIVQTVKCSCGRIHAGTFPEEVNAPTQYGSRVRALAVYLNQYQHLPYERTCEALSDLFCCSLSQGTLRNILADCHEKLEESEEAIKQQIQRSQVAHFDETGMRAGGKTCWIHSASTESATHYHIHRKRGADASVSAGILPHFKGTAIHDGWKSYMSFECRHGLCNAHHLRELIFIDEQFCQQWTKAMSDLLKQINISVQEAKEQGRTSLKRKLLKRYAAHYDQIIVEAYAENPEKASTGPPRRGRKKKSKPLNLIERLDKQRNEVLLFMNDFSVPFDNNLAERDIRMAKLKQKISGCFRDFTGAEIFCRIRSYISSARKNDIDAMNALTKVFAGTPFIMGS